MVGACGDISGVGKPVAASAGIPAREQSAGPQDGTDDGSELFYFPRSQVYLSTRYSNHAYTGK